MTTLADPTTPPLTPGRTHPTMTTPICTGSQPLGDATGSRDAP